MLLQYYRLARILKRKNKQRPEWQDYVPRSQAGRDNFEIAAKHQKKFEVAFKDAIKSILPQRTPSAFRERFASKDIEALTAVLPLFSDPGMVLNKLVDKLSEAYHVVMTEAGDAATEELNKVFKTKLAFTMTPPGGVIKAAKRTVVTVEVNPYSTRWIKKRGLELAKNLSEGQVAVVRGILENGFEKGVRVEEAYNLIRANIGLTERDAALVQRRADLLEEQGYQPEDIEDMVDEYREKKLDQRAELIGRTETIAAQNKGREDAWQLAADSGQLPPVKRVWDAAPESPNPNRPCEICVGLHNTSAELGEPFESEEGPIDGPPAHPGCRCTERLVRAEAGD